MPNRDVPSINDKGPGISRKALLPDVGPLRDLRTGSLDATEGLTLAACSEGARRGGLVEGLIRWNAELTDEVSCAGITPRHLIDEIACSRDLESPVRALKRFV